MSETTSSTTARRGGMDDTVGTARGAGLGPIGHDAAVPVTGLHRTLGFTAPLCPDNLFGHLVATAVPGVEEWHDGAYRRTLALPGGPGGGGAAARRRPAWTPP